jgi:hypothetical protein
MDTLYYNPHVKYVPCHHCMARRQVQDGADDLQIRRVAENTMNKQSSSADRGWAISLRYGPGTNK